MNDNNSPVTISALEIEHVKRVRAVHMKPTAAGLTVIGGRNGAGKTSVLDAIAWALGGKRREPSSPKNADAIGNLRIALDLSNGVHVERRGKNSALVVTDPDGQKSGQQLLDAFVSQFAIDMPRFMNASAKEKAEVLLDIIGVGKQLVQMDKQEEQLYHERRTIGQVATSKKKHAEELREYPDAPEEPISASELIREQQAILARNCENQHKRDMAEKLRADLGCATERVATLEQQLTEARQKLADVSADYDTARKSAADLQDESTRELEAQLEHVEAVNAQVSANKQKEAALDEAQEYQAQYDRKTEALEAVRAERRALLENADLPLPGLTVAAGELVYNGQQWDCMSGAEQLRVATSIVRAQSPHCGFVLLDKLEQMDLETLTEFGTWLEAEGLQVIATRVSTGEECTIVIEDGLSAGKTITKTGEDNE